MSDGLGCFVLLSLQPEGLVSVGQDPRFGKLVRDRDAEQFLLSLFVAPHIKIQNAQALQGA